jgi:hypothetical protein
MKFLNLDELAVTNRTVTIGGKDYPVQEMSVGNFIETSKETESLKAKGDVSVSENMESTITMIKRFIPTLDDSVARAMNMKQLGTLMRFIRGELDEDKEAAPAEGESAGEPNVVSNQ